MHSSGASRRERGCVSETGATPTAVIARLDGATQYSRDADMESRRRGVLDTPRGV
jgi:hypothetical protein